MESYTSPLKLVKSKSIIPIDPRKPRRCTIIDFHSHGKWYTDHSFMIKMKRKNFSKQDKKRLRKHFTEESIDSPEILENPLPEKYSKDDGHSVVLPLSQINIMHDIGDPFDIPIKGIIEKVVRFFYDSESYFYDNEYLDIINGNYENLTYEIVYTALRIKSNDTVVAFIMPLMGNGMTEIEYMEKNNKYKVRKDKYKKELIKYKKWANRIDGYRII